MINFKRKTLLNTQQKHFIVFSQHFLQSMADGTAWNKEQHKGQRHNQDKSNLSSWFCLHRNKLYTSFLSFSPAH